MNKKQIEKFIQQRDEISRNSQHEIIELFNKALKAAGYDIDDKSLFDSTEMVAEFAETFGIDTRVLLSLYPTEGDNEVLKTIATLLMLNNLALEIKPVTETPLSFDFNDEVETEDFSSYTRQECVDYIMEHGLDSLIDIDECSGKELREFLTQHESDADNDKEDFIKIDIEDDSNTKNTKDVLDIDEMVKKFTDDFKKVLTSNNISEKIDEFAKKWL